MDRNGRLRAFSTISRRDRCHVNSIARFISTFKSEIRVYLRSHSRDTHRVTSLVPFLITGEGDDYLTVSLRDGGAAVGMTLAKGRLDLHIKPARVRFDDNQWHKIVVHRKVQEVISCFYFLFEHSLKQTANRSI